MTKRHAKLFVWDFHGTLEKGNDDAIVEITNIILEKNKFAIRMTMQDAERLAGHRWSDYYAALLPEETTEVHHQLQQESSSFSLKNPDFIAKYVKLNEHAREVLTAIHHSHHSQIVISNTQPKSLDLFLSTVGIDNFFPEPHRIGAYIPDKTHVTKVDLLNEFLLQYPHEEGLITIGDSPGDMTLANCHPKGVGYYYTHPGRIHRDSHYHFKINSLKDILQEV